MPPVVAGDPGGVARLAGLPCLAPSWAWADQRAQADEPRHGALRRRSLLPHRGRPRYPPPAGGLRRAAALRRVVAFFLLHRILLEESGIIPHLLHLLPPPRHEGGEPGDRSLLHIGGSIIFSGHFRSVLPAEDRGKESAPCALAPPLQGPRLRRAEEPELLPALTLRRRVAVGVEL